MPKRILLADDSAAARKSVENALDSGEYELIVAEDGPSAMELVESRRPHAVLAHAMLPGMDGYELCRAVKDRPETSHIPVMLLTGTFEPFDINRAKEVRYDGFITKPVDGRELQRSLSAAIGAAVYPAAYDADPAPAETGEPHPVEADTVSEYPETAPAADSGSDVMLDKIFPEEEEPLGDFLSEPGEETITVEDSPEEDIFSIVEPMPEEPKSAELPAETDTADEDEAEAGDESADGEGSDLSWFLDKYQEKRGEEAPATEADEDSSVGSFFSPPLEAPAPEGAPGEAETIVVDETPAPPASPFFEEPAEVPDAEESEPAAAEALEPLPAEQAGAGPTLADIADESKPGTPALDDDQIERIARRVVELLSDKVVRDVAWEAVPEIAERLIRERIREIEARVEESS